MGDHYQCCTLMENDIEHIQWIRDVEFAFCRQPLWLWCGIYIRSDLTDKVFMNAVRFDTTISDYSPCCLGEKGSSKKRAKTRRYDEKPKSPSPALMVRDCSSKYRSDKWSNIWTEEDNSRIGASIHWCCYICNNPICDCYCSFSSTNCHGSNLYEAKMVLPEAPKL